MKPRQLRALVMLLVLLPLIPTAFVVRFLVEAIYNEHLESRERIKPVYHEFLETSTATLAGMTARQISSADALRFSGPGTQISMTNETADAVVTVAPDGKLSRLPSRSSPDHDEVNGPANERLINALVGSTVRYPGTPTSGPVRWRFLSDFPEQVFALRPSIRPEPGSPVVLLVKTRRHLLDSINTFYSHTLDPQSALRVIDENGDEVPLVGPIEAGTGEVLAETLLPPPLPAWRVQLFSVDTAFIDGLAQEQIAFSAWAVGGMVVFTGTIAGVAGILLRRRIALQEMRNDILAIVSHEMRTPLASSRMFIDTLLERRFHGGPEQADEYLRLISQENQRLERLAESFLTLSRLHGQRGRGGALKLVTVSAEDVISAAVERLRPRLEAPGCRFELAPTGRQIDFPADLDALTTVLVNLLENALKYTGDDKRIRLCAYVHGGNVCFEVSDNGQGIDPSEQGRIFERFYQSDQRLARSHDGCGLGLSLVQSIVEAHGGTVTVESELGRGSVFMVRIPLANTPGEARTEPDALAGSVMR